MKAKLIHHSFPDDPSWIVVDKSVPLGTIYEVIGYQGEGIQITNLETGKTRPVECYFVSGNNDLGWLPAVCFEVLES